MTVEHYVQAQRFLAWYGKMEHTTLDEAWDQWCENKALPDADRREIRRLVDAAVRGSKDLRVKP